MSATATGQAAIGVEQVSQIAAETGAAASQVFQAARELSHQAEELRARVKDFLDGIRAA